jgi:hypothetical protein
MSLMADSENLKKNLNFLSQKFDIDSIKSLRKIKKHGIITHIHSYVICNFEKRPLSLQDKTICSFMTFSKALDNKIKWMIKY